MTKEQYYKVLEVGKLTGYGLMHALTSLKINDWDIEKAVKYLKEHEPFGIS